MKRNHFLTLVLLMLLTAWQGVTAQQRRPIDSQHPLWLIHVDVWYQADPQKIIDLIPDDIKPYVCLNLSLSCAFNTELNTYHKPQNAFQTYKSWGTVCQQNGMWFTCQPASGGHTHIQDYDMVTFEYFFKTFPNFLGWNYAEQFWGFDEAGDKSSSTQTDRWALFARLVEMSHKYGGLLTVSFCGNVWSHPLNPIGELKRTKAFLEACQKYPENMLFLYKYTTSSCFYNNESVSFGPFVSGLTKNYGVRYDNCGWNGAMDALLGEGHGKKYPAAAGIGTVMEQTCVNGGAVWDGPELTWREECFYEASQTTVDGYKRRVWKRFDNMNGVWNDMFKKIIDGTMYIPTREEVVGKQKVVVINDVTSGSDEDKYATWGDLYNGLYKQTDPFNRGNGQWMDNFCYFKSTGRYGAIPLVTGLYDDAAKAIPVQVRKSQRTSKWNSQAKKLADFNAQYPEVSKGDLYVNRYRNQLVTYTPYTYLNKKTRAEAVVPLEYNTCETMVLKYDKLSSGVIREFSDHIEFYLNNHRNDTTALRTDTIILTGCQAEPVMTYKRHTFNKNIGQNKAEQHYGADSQTDTIVVTHCGGMDVSVNCTGTADRSGKTDAIAITPLPLPKQPAPYRGPIIIEAEDMDFRNISNCVTNAYDYNWGAFRSVRGHAGMGFADMGTSTSGALRHQLKLKDGQEGAYTVYIRYTCTDKAGNVNVKVNDDGNVNVNCTRTAKNEWKTVSMKAVLNAGTNNLVITNTGGLPMYIDQIIYQPDDVDVMRYAVTVMPTDGGTVEANTAEAAEGETVTLTITPDEGCTLQELRIVNSVFYAWDTKLAVTDRGEVTFQMPHDNVTIQPVFINENKKDMLNLAATVAGTIPEGWRTTDGSDVRDYPYSNGQGPRTMVGFTGYQGKALYWRNTSAEYGRLSAWPLSLQPGSYQLTFAVAAWAGSPQYKVSILNSSNSTIKSSANLTAAPNANKNTNADLSSAKQQTLAFDVTKADNYVVKFASVSGGFTEFLLLECKLDKSTTGITPISSTLHPQPSTLYSPSGVKRQKFQRGLNIIVESDGHTKKVFIP